MKMAARLRIDPKQPFFSAHFTSFGFEVSTGRSSWPVHSLKPPSKMATLGNFRIYFKVK